MGSDDVRANSGEETDTGEYTISLAHTRERDELVRDMVTLVRENELLPGQTRTITGGKEEGKHIHGRSSSASAYYCR